MTDSVSTSVVDITTRECHGCSGLGWVETSRGEVKVCPVCEGSGVTGAAPFDPYYPAPYVPYYPTPAPYYPGPLPYPYTPPWYDHVWVFS